MVWYYVKDGARQGPVEEVELNRLVAQSVVRPETLVWSEGMSDWRPYSTVAPGGSALYSAPPEAAAVEEATPVAAASPVSAATPFVTADPIVEPRVEPRIDPYIEPRIEPTPQPAYGAPVAAMNQMPVEQASVQQQASIGAAVAAPAHYCSQCGRPYPSEELVRFGAATVCANCKEIYAQRLRETGQVAGTRVYGGFWIRFIAVFIDGIALWIVNFAIQTVTFTRVSPGDLSNMGLVMSSIGINFVISIALQMTYEAFFLVRFGATPGKMIFKLKVITAEGGGLTWGRAIARYFAKILSGITLMIGYIMAGFDSEKRALHDYIVGTRVIRTA